MTASSDGGNSSSSTLSKKTSNDNKPQPSEDLAGPAAGPPVVTVPTTETDGVKSITVINSKPEEYVTYEISDEVQTENKNDTPPPPPPIIGLDVNNDNAVTVATNDTDTPPPPPIIGPLEGLETRLVLVPAVSPFPIELSGYFLWYHPFIATRGKRIVVFTSVLSVIMSVIWTDYSSVDEMRKLYEEQRALEKAKFKSLSDSNRSSESEFLERHCFDFRGPYYSNSYRIANAITVFIGLACYGHDMYLPILKQLMLKYAEPWIFMIVSLRFYLSIFISETECLDKAHQFALELSDNESKYPLLSDPSICSHFSKFACFMSYIVLAFAVGWCLGFSDSVQSNLRTKVAVAIVVGVYFLFSYFARFTQRMNMVRNEEEEVVWTSQDIISNSESSSRILLDLVHLRKTRPNKQRVWLWTHPMSYDEHEMGSNLLILFQTIHILRTYFSGDDFFILSTEVRRATPEEERNCFCNNPNRNMFAKFRKSTMESLMSANKKSKNSTAVVIPDPTSVASSVSGSKNFGHMISVKNVDSTLSSSGAAAEPGPGSMGLMKQIVNNIGQAGDIVLTGQRRKSMERVVPTVANNLNHDNSFTASSPNGVTKNPSSRLSKQNQLPAVTHHSRSLKSTTSIGPVGSASGVGPGLGLAPLPSNSLLPNPASALAAVPINAVMKIKSERRQSMKRNVGHVSTVEKSQSQDGGGRGVNTIIGLESRSQDQGGVTDLTTGGTESAEPLQVAVNHHRSSTSESGQRQRRTSFGQVFTSVKHKISSISTRMREIEGVTHCTLTIPDENLPIILSGGSFLPRKYHLFSSDRPGTGLAEKYVSKQLTFWHMFSLLVVVQGAIWINLGVLGVSEYPLLGDEEDGNDNAERREGWALKEYNRLVREMGGVEGNYSLGSNSEYYVSRLKQVADLLVNTVGGNSSTANNDYARPTVVTTKSSSNTNNSQQVIQATLTEIPFYCKTELNFSNANLIVSLFVKIAAFYLLACGIYFPLFKMSVKRSRFILIMIMALRYFLSRCVTTVGCYGLYQEAVSEVERLIQSSGFSSQYDFSSLPTAYTPFQAFLLQLNYIFTALIIAIGVGAVDGFLIIDRKTRRKKAMGFLGFVFFQLFFYVRNMTHLASADELEETRSKIKVGLELDDQNNLHPVFTEFLGTSNTYISQQSSRVNSFLIFATSPIPIDMWRHSLSSHVVVIAQGALTVWNLVKGREFAHMDAKLTRVG